MLINATESLAENIGAAPACKSMGIARSTLYYKRTREQRSKEEQKSKEDWITIKFDPIIKKDRFNIVKSITQENKSKPKKSHYDHKDDFLAKGLLHCGECGGKMRPKPYAPDKLFYICHWNISSNKVLESKRRTKCILEKVDAGLIDEEVYAKIITDQGLWGYEDMLTLSGQLYNQVVNK